MWQSVLEVVPRDSHSSWLTTITITGERVTEEIKRESIPDGELALIEHRCMGD